MSNPTAKELAELNETSHKKCSKNCAIDIVLLFEDRRLHEDVNWEDIHQRLEDIYNEIRPNTWD